jgi:hypothetical protein
VGLSREYGNAVAFSIIHQGQKIVMTPASRKKGLCRVYKLL